MPLKIFSWNINGLRAILKKGDLEFLIKEQNPDIICLQEIKAKEHQVDIDFPDYQEIWHPAERPGYSGTAILTKITPLSIQKDFPTEIIDKFKLKDDSYGDPNAEGRVLAAEFADFYLLNVYVPNAKDDLSRRNLRHDSWDPATLAYIKQLEKHKPVVFCGDLNVAHQEIDLARPKDNTKSAGFTPEERHGMNEYLANGLTDSFRFLHPEKIQYSWWSFRSGARARNVGWRIDYFLISKSIAPKLRSAKIHDDILGSDHCPVSIILDDII